jgi:translation elongation factor EF-4
MRFGNEIERRLDAVPNETEIGDLVLAFAQEVPQINLSSIHSDFHESSLNSLHASILTTKLARRFDLKQTLISPTVLYNYPNAFVVAKYICSIHNGN